MQQIQSLGQEDPLKKEMAPHSSILAWEIPWTDKPGGLQSMGSQRVRHDLAIKWQWRVRVWLYKCTLRVLFIVAWVWKKTLICKVCVSWRKFSKLSLISFENFLIKENGWFSFVFNLKLSLLMYKDIFSWDSKNYRR